MDKFYSAVKSGETDSLVSCIEENQEFENKCITVNRKTAITVAIENEILSSNDGDPNIRDAIDLDCLRYKQFANQTGCLNLYISDEIRKKSLHQSCYDIIIKGCPNLFSAFIKIKRNCGESELNIFNSVEQSYSKLLTKNINLSNEMKRKVEIFLIDNNYKKPKWTDNLEDCYSKTKLDLLQVCDELKPSLRSELLILKFKMILKHLSALKLLHFRLKYSKDNLCWNQIEFLISLFICIREQRLEINFIYMNLKETLLISYIQLFLDDLKNSENNKLPKEDINSLQQDSKKLSKKLNKKSFVEISKKQKETRASKKLVPTEIRIKANKLKQAEIKLEPRLKRANNIRNELKKNYNHLKNITTIERMISKIQTALDIDLSQDGVIGVYAIRRVLQIIGEGVKSTDSSPNISKSSKKNIIELAPKSLIDITTNLRDALSHGAIFRYSDSLNFNELKKYKQLQDELKNILNFLVNLLYKERCYGVKVFFHKILKCKDLTQIIKLKKYFPFKEYKFSEKYCLQMGQFNEKWKKFSSEFTNPSEEELVAIRNINFYLEGINSKLGQEAFDKNLINFNFITKLFHVHDTLSKITSRLYLQDIKNQHEFSNIGRFRKQISANVDKLQTMLETQKDKQKQWNEIKELGVYIQLDNANPLKAINALKFNLEHIPLFKIEQSVTNLLSRLLEKIENKTNLEEEIERHKNIYFAKKKMIEFIKKNPISDENCNELENMAKSVGIDFKYVKMNYLKGDKFKASKNIENMTSIYGKLVKDMKLYLEGPLKFKLQKNAIEKFFNSNEFKINSNDDKKWLKNILQNHQNHSDHKIMEYLLKLKTDLCHLFPLNIPTNVKSITEEYAKYKENGKLQSAVEMILFEIFQIIFEDYDKSEQDHSSMLTGPDLRNYLAHGNIFFDVFAINPARIIFMNAIKLITMEDDSYLIMEDFRRSVEKEIKNIYQMRSSFFEDGKTHSHQPEIYEPYSYWQSTFSNKLVINEPQSYLKNSHLLPAVFHKHIQIVEILCKRGVPVNEIVPELTMTPLMVASRIGHLSIVNLLLNYGGDISICDNEGWNSLMIALYYDHTKVAECLLEHLLRQDESYLKKVVNCFQPDGPHIFHAALQKASIKIVKKLFETKQIDVNMIYNGKSFLHFACLLGRSSIVKFLISAKAKINVEDHCGKTPIAYAVRSGNIKITKLLLKERPKLNGLLYEAMYENDLKMLKLLIKNNADVYELNKSDQNILSSAIYHDHSEIAVYLIEKKIFDLNFCEDGQTYLHLAAKTTSVKIMEALIKYSEFQTILNAKDKFDATPLRNAVTFSNTDIIKCLVLNGADILNLHYLQYSLYYQLDENIIPLLECGADVNYIDADGNNPLLVSIYLGNIYTVQTLIDFGADFELFGNYQLTPLMLAVLLAHYDIVLVLLQAGAKITTESVFKWLFSNVTTEEINWENIEIIKLLIEMGSVVENCWDVELTTTIVDDVSNNLKMILNSVEYAEDDCLFSPLHMAIRNNDTDTVNLLASAEEFINCRYSVDDLTPVLLSVILNRLEHLNILIDAGADVNGICYQNMTPLIFATESKNYEMVETLLKAGADVNAKTMNGRTALFYAAQSGQIEIVKLLIQYGGKIDKILCISLLDFKNLHSNFTFV